MTYIDEIEELRAELRECVALKSTTRWNANSQISSASVEAMAAEEGLEPPPQARTPVCGSAVEGVLDCLGRREGQLLRRGDLDRRSRRGIAPLARRRLFYLKLTKAGQAGFSAALGGVGNLFEYTLDDHLGLSLGQALLGCDLVGNFVGRCHQKCPMVESPNHL